MEQVFNLNGAKNQFIIRDDKGEWFKSYDSMIVFTPKEGKIQLDKKYYAYSKTTVRHRNIYLNTDTKTVEKRIKDGEYELTDLNPEPDISGMLGLVGMVARMGAVFCDNQKDQNDWKARMLKAGLGEGLIMPEDWGALSEDEKERRLNNAINII
jgi:hypothetical protein